MLPVVSRLYSTSFCHHLISKASCAFIDSARVNSTRKLHSSFALLTRSFQSQVSSHKEADEREQVSHFFDEVNHKLQSTKHEPQFAVVHFYGVQHLLKEGDIVMVKKDVATDVGEKIKLEKVLLAGNRDVTLIGRPLLDRNLVNVEVMCIERTMSHTILSYRWEKKSGGFKRWRWRRYPLTMFRVSQVKICHELNKTQTEIY